MAKLTVEALRSERLAKARSLQQTLERQYAASRAERIARDAVANEPLAGTITDHERRVLDGLSLAKRRYGIARPTYATLKPMGCASLGDLARLTRRHADNWLGYARADQLRLRIVAIREEIRDGAPEPGITRIGPDLSADDLAWLAGQDLNALQGFGLTANAAKSLRRDGYRDLAALARAECDAILDADGFGEARVARLRTGLAEYLAARPVTRDHGRDDAEWDAAAPKAKRTTR